MKITTYIHVLAIGVTLSWSSSVLAQTTMPLSLDTAIARAMENNWQVKKVHAQMGMAKSDLMQANQAFLPNINISETFVTTTDPLNVFGIKLKQQVVTAADFNPDLLNNPDAINNFTTRISVEQPLLNFDAFAGRGAAASAVKASELNLQWTKNLIALKTKSLYFNLQLASKQKEVLESSLIALQENQKVAQNMFDEGLIQKVNLLDMDLRINGIETKLLETENQINNTTLQLSHFLGLDITTQIIPTDTIQDYTLVNIETANKNISTTRSDIQALEFQLKASNRMLNSSKMGFLPRLNAFGSYEWNEDRAFGTFANNYMLGARLEWDIFKGGKNIGKMQKMKHQHNMMQITYDEKISDSKRKLIKVKQQIDLSKKHVALSKKAVEQSKEAYKIKSDRYAEGLEKTSDLLLAENVMLNKQLMALQSINFYQQLIFNLELLLEQDLIKK